MKGLARDGTRLPSGARSTQPQPGGPGSEAKRRPVMADIRRLKENTSMDTAGGVGMRHERAIWHPFWYELDQSIAVGETAEFDFFKTPPDYVANEGVASVLSR